MSVRLLSAVLDGFPRGGSEKLVLIAMADWANDSGGSLFPSMTAIARRACISKRQAQRIIRSLEEDGYLRVVENATGGAPKATPHYQLIAGRLTGSTHARGDMDDTGDASVTGDMGDAEGCHGCHPTHDNHVTRSTIEPSLTVSASRKPVSGKPKQLAAAFAEFWQAYPKRVSKGVAEKAWTAIKPDAALLALMLAAIARAKAGKWQRDGGKFVPHPATWLHAKAWLDEDSAPATASASQPRSRPTLAI